MPTTSTITFVRDAHGNIVRDAKGRAVTRTELHLASTVTAETGVPTDTAAALYDEGKRREMLRSKVGVPLKATMRFLSSTSTPVELGPRPGDGSVLPRKAAQQMSPQDHSRQGAMGATYRPHRPASTIKVK